MAFEFNTDPALAELMDSIRGNIPADEVASKQAANLTQAQYDEYQARLEAAKKSGYTPPKPDPLQFGLEKLQEEAAQRDAELRAGQQDSAVAFINETARKGGYDPSPSALALGASTNQIRASVQPNGVVSLTNIGTPKIVSHIQDLTGVSGKDGFSLETIDSSIKGMENIKDPVELAKAHSKLIEDSANYVNGVKKSAFDAAKAQLGIPTMEVQLQKALALDTQLRAAGRGLEATNAIAWQQKIEQGNKVAEEMATKAISNNTTVAAISAKMASLSPTLEAIGKKVGYENTQALMDASAFASTPDYEIENLKTLNPTKTADPSSLIKIVKQLTPEGQLAVKSRPEELPRMVITNPDNLTARQLLVANMQKQGSKESEIKDSINTMTSLMRDEKAFRKAYETVLSPQEKEGNKYLLSPIPPTNKEEKASFNARKADIVLAYMNRKATQEFTDNVTTWMDVSNNAPLAEAIGKVRSLNQEPTLENVAKMYIGSAQGQEGVRKIELINLVANSARARTNRLLGNVDAERLIMEFPLLVAPRRSVSAQLSEDINPAVRVGYDFIWGSDVKPSEDSALLAEQQKILNK